MKSIARKKKSQPRKVISTKITTKKVKDMHITTRKVTEVNITVKVTIMSISTRKSNPHKKIQPKKCPP